MLSTADSVDLNDFPSSKAPKSFHDAIEPFTVPGRGGSLTIQAKSNLSQRQLLELYYTADSLTAMERAPASEAVL